MIHTTSATLMSTKKNEKEENSPNSLKKIKDEPKVKPDEKKNRKTLHNKLFGDIHELEVKRDSNRKDYSDVFSSLSDSPMEPIEKDIE
jgi:hypothetical protein